MKYYSLFSSMVLAAIIAVACEKDSTDDNVGNGTPTPPPVVERITLNETVAFMAFGETLQLTPTVVEDLPVAWHSSDEAVAYVDEEGLVTALGNGTATVTATIDNAEDGSASCDVTVNKIGRASFKSDNTWTVGDRTWSDVVVASGCKKNKFNGGLKDGPYESDCRESTSEEYGHLFSWQAVNLHRDQLCPDDWRVPERDDYKALDIAFGGNGIMTQNDPDQIAKYVEQWGARFSGFVNGLNQINTNGATVNPQGTVCYHWTLTEYKDYYEDEVAWYAFALYISKATNYVIPEFSQYKHFGYALRCVKLKNIPNH